MTILEYGFHDLQDQILRAGLKILGRQIQIPFHDDGLTDPIGTMVHVWKVVLQHRRLVLSRVRS